MNTNKSRYNQLLVDEQPTFAGHNQDTYAFEPGNPPATVSPHVGATSRDALVSHNEYDDSIEPGSTDTRRRTKRKMRQFAAIRRELKKAPKDHKESMRSHFDTPYQAGVAILIVATMVLFAYSNRSLGASVRVSVTPIINSALNMNSDSDGNVHNNHESLSSMIDYMLTVSEKYPVVNTEINTMLSNTIVSGMDGLINFNSKMVSDNSKNIHNMTNLNQNNTGNDLPTYSTTVFTFTLVSSIEDFVNADAWILAIVIAGFSGVWPYIKLLALLWVWVLPVSANRRDWGLLLLDQFGKFSFVDLFVTMFMVVSFYVRIKEEV